MNRQEMRDLYDRRQAAIQRVNEVRRSPEGATGALTDRQGQEWAEALGDFEAADKQIRAVQQPQIDPEMSKDPSKRNGGDGTDLRTDWQVAGAETRGVFTAEQRAGVVSAVQSRAPYRLELENRAAVFGGTLLPTAGNAVAPGVYPGAMTAIAGLFPIPPADGPSVRFYRLNSSTAAVVAEGAVKPDSGAAVTPVDLTLVKVASTVQFSDELAEDAAQMIGYLQEELRQAVVTAENTRVLADFNATIGILTATGTTVTVLDLLADVIATMEAANGATPSAFVVHPTVMAVIRKAKASTGGDYYVDLTAAAPQTVHGVPIISTPSTAAGTAWAMTSQGAQIYRRGPISVDIGYSADDWQRNLRTMRVEERFGTAVIRPSMHTKITLT